LSQAIPSQNRNVIIGGDFTTNPWQRGTSGFTAYDYSADRWSTTGLQDGAYTIAKTADAPTASQAGVYTAHCLHLDVTTADASLAAGQHLRFFQPIEGFNAARFGFGQASTRYITVSFWHKHTKTGTNCVALTNSAANRSIRAEYTQSVSDTWEKAEITFPVDTTGTWLYDNGIGLYLIFSIAEGTNFHGTADTWSADYKPATANQVNNLDNVANNFKIALVQLEAGPQATDFEARDAGTELALCQRYYERIDGDNSFAAAGWAGSSTFGYGIVHFKETMRVHPTLSYSNATHFSFSQASGLYAGTALTLSSNNHESALIYVTSSGMTAGQGGGVYIEPSSGGWIAFDAEL
jgi:hypothetical protein